jgi:hypothetical protein
VGLGEDAAENLNAFPRENFSAWSANVRRVSNHTPRMRVGVSWVTARGSLRPNVDGHGSEVEGDRIEILEIVAGERREASSLKRSTKNTILLKPLSVRISGKNQIRN